MHKIEIRRKADVPENKLSSGMNTELLIDGVQIKTAQSVTLVWDAAGTCTATIKMTGNIQAEFYGEEKPKLEDQQFLLIPTGENAARLSTVALKRVRRGSEEEADLRAKQDEARQKKVRAFVVRYKLKPGKDTADGWTGEQHFLPGELCHPKGELRIQTTYAELEEAIKHETEFAQAVVSTYNANREMIQELDQFAPRLEPERVLLSWGWEEVDAWVVNTMLREEAKQELQDKVKAQNLQTVAENLREGPPEGEAASLAYREERLGKRG